MPNRALREWRVAHCGLTPTELARAVGWFDGRGKPDSQRVRRSLGLASTMTKGVRYWRELISYNNAVALARAMGADPVDFDL